MFSEISAAAKEIAKKTAETAKETATKMIESTKESAVKSFDSTKESAIKGFNSIKESSSKIGKFPDSERPSSGKIERPSLTGKSPEKAVFPDTARPVSGKIERPSLMGKSPEKAVFPDTARPVSGKIERPSLMGKSPEKAVFPDTTRPVSGKIERPQLVDTELSNKEKKDICKKTGWSNETVDMMKSKQEAEIYMKANLKEAEIDGKKCLIRSDIEMDFKDEFGRTNKERMENGMSPLTNSGEKVELHHIGQKPDSPLAELTTQEHRGKGNDTVLHDKQKVSEINRNIFNGEKEHYWKSRTAI